MSGLSRAAHRIVDRLAAGSRIVWERRRAALGEWAQAPELAWEVWFRVAILLGLGYLLWLVAQAHHKVMWLLLAGWAVAAWRAGGKPKPPPAAAEPEAEAEEPDGDDGPSPDDAVAALQHLLGDVGGVLLTALRDHLDVADTGVVKELLTEAGVEYRDGVRTVLGNGPGVHRNDIPPPSPTPSGAPVGGVGAGERANNNTNNARVRRYESGAVAVFTEDPANPHRTHIHWSKTP